MLVIGRDPRQSIALFDEATGQQIATITHNPSAARDSIGIVAVDSIKIVRAELVARYTCRKCGFAPGFTKPREASDLDCPQCGANAWLPE